MDGRAYHCNSEVCCRIAHARRCSCGAKPRSAFCVLHSGAALVVSCTLSGAKDRMQHPPGKGAQRMCIPQRMCILYGARMPLVVCRLPRCAGPRSVRAACAGRAGPSKPQALTCRRPQPCPSQRGISTLKGSQCHRAFIGSLGQKKPTKSDANTRTFARVQRGERRARTMP